MGSRRTRSTAHNEVVSLNLVPVMLVLAAVAADYDVSSESVPAALNKCDKRIGQRRSGKERDRADDTAPGCGGDR